MEDELPLPPPDRLVTARVRESASEVVAALDAAGVCRDRARVDARLERLFALSPYVMETCRRRPGELVRLLAEGALDRPGAGREALVAELAAALGIVSATSTAAAPVVEPGTTPTADPVAGASAEPGSVLAVGAVDAADVPESAALAALRAFRHRHLLRILWRELERLATLDDTLGDLTRLAEACIVVATRLAEAVEVRRSGTPRDAAGHPQTLICLGMGKLGGGELNVSSDIDLICLWPAPGTTDGRRRVDNGEHFARVVRRLTRLLASPTVDGFAFRVDTRLRPFGESGPPAMHLDAFEHYLLTQGRGWERYAMVKARAITGDADSIAQLESLLRPFVYRRYIDYDALVSLAVLKGKIRHSLATRPDRTRPGRHDDVKLGPGGIREVEFTGQAFQLMHGGRELRLQRRPIRVVLQTLGELGFLPTEEVRALIAAYGYLRRVENALQGMRDEQTHTLPAEGDDLVRLVAMLGERDVEAFRATLDAHRTVVERCFEAVLGEAGNSEADAAGAPRAGERLDVVDGSEGADGARAWLERFGIAAEPALLERVLALAGGPFHRRLTARAQQRVERILPRLVAAAAATETPAVALERGLDFVRAVAGRSGYLQALADRPSALARLVRLFGASGWVATLVTRHPIVLDELIGQSVATLFADAATVRDEALAEAARLAGADLERQMDALRHFRQARELRIAAAALEGELEPMQASDRLSWLAEALIAAALELVVAPLAARHAALPELVVVAYGKLGGLELGFGSDLDLVFLRAEEGEAESAARLVRRFVHFMGTVTPAGRIHEIDLRLRPNGNAGVLVGTLASFESYQRGEAWTWEHQALLRARAVYGPAALRERFAAVRRSVLCTPRDAAALRADVASMRARMRATLGASEPGVMHLKQDAGGIADIEFVVQYLALRHAADAPSLVRFTDNVRVLEEAGRLGLLAPADVRGLRDDYIELRERLHRRSLALADAVVPLDPALEALRERVVERRERILGPAPDRQP